MMVATSDVLLRLRTRYTIEQTGVGRYLLTHADGHELDAPAVLELDDRLMETYVDRIARTSEQGNYGAAVGLVAIHVEEELEAALATGGELHSIGLRRSRLTRQPEWFVDRTEGSKMDLPEPGSYEWRT